MEPKALLIIMGILFIFSIAYEVFNKNKTKNYLDQLSEYLMKQDYDKFDELIEDDKIKRNIPIYNRNFLKLNEALMRQDDSRCEELFKTFDSLRMSDTQKVAIYSNGFYYYMNKNNNDEATKYFNLLKQTNQYKNNHVYDRIYDTYILKGYKFLEETEQLAKDNPKLLMLVADMYRNKGDDKKADEYEMLTKEKLNLQ